MYNETTKRMDAVSKYAAENEFWRIMTEKQLQELEQCKLNCQHCSIKKLRGEKPCFSWVVEKLRDFIDKRPI